jgi:hypothetical protein
MALLALSLVLVPTSQGLRRGQPWVFFTPRQGAPKRSDGGLVLGRNASRKGTRRYAKAMDLKFVRYAASHPMVFVGGQGIPSHIA